MEFFKTFYIFIQSSSLDVLMVSVLYSMCLIFFIFLFIFVFQTHKTWTLFKHFESYNAYYKTPESHNHHCKILIVINL